MMCKCTANSKLVYVNNSKGCPICTCVVEKENQETRGVLAVDECSLPKLTGLCRARFTRYYHNSDTKSCEVFVYGGCQGNSNNFFTKLACENKCLPKEDPSKQIFSNKKRRSLSDV